ncbi:MAG: hypothetical protein AB1515_02470 [Nitrospirota bacterium]
MTIEHELLRSDTWRALTASAVRAYIAIRAKYAGPGTADNIILTYEEAETTMGMSSATFGRALRELRNAGLITITPVGSAKRWTNIISIRSSFFDRAHRLSSPYRSQQ